MGDSWPTPDDNWLKLRYLLIMDGVWMDSIILHKHRIIIEIVILLQLFSQKKGSGGQKCNTRKGWCIGNLFHGITIPLKGDCVGNLST